MDRSKIMMPSLSNCKTVPEFINALKQHAEIFKKDPISDVPFGDIIKMVTNYSEEVMKEERKTK